MNASSNEAQALYIQIGHLVETMPDLNKSSHDAASAKWLGQAYALVAQVDVLQAKNLADLSHKLSTPHRLSAASASFIEHWHWPRHARRIQRRGLSFQPGTISMQWRLWQKC